MSPILIIILTLAIYSVISTIIITVADAAKGNVEDIAYILSMGIIGWVLGLLSIPLNYFTMHTKILLQNRETREETWCYRKDVQRMPRSNKYTVERKLRKRECRNIPKATL